MYILEKLKKCGLNLTIGYFSNPMHTNQCRIRYENGDFYEGQLKNSKFHGHGTYIYHNQAKYCGEFKNGVKSGYGKLIWKDGNSDFR